MVPCQHSPEAVLILRDLKFGPANIHDIRFLIGVSLRGAYRHIRALRTAQRIRIVGHERKNGGCPLYGLKNHDDEPDARRPVPLTSAQRMQRVRVRRGGKS